MDLLNGTVQMHTGLVMHIHHHRTDLRGLGNITLGGVDHIMYVKGLLTDLGYGLNHWETKRDIGNKRPVHDVQVKPVGLTLVDHGNVTVEMQKISCKQRWGNK